MGQEAFPWGLKDDLKTHDLSLYFTSSGKQCLPCAVPLCVGRSSTTDSGEIVHTEKDTTFFMGTAN